MNSKSARRTKWLLIVAAVLSLLISTLRLPHPHSRPFVNLSFIGFTNSGAGVEALFALTNPPKVAVTLHSVRAAAHGDQSGATQERGTWGRKESWGLAYALSVDTTNEPLRVLLKFQQRAVGPRRF